MALPQKDSKTSDLRAPNPNDPKVSDACNAMKCLGISSAVVKPVLKHLLKLYAGRWELIEEDNYRTLADAIFESADDKKSNNVTVHDEQDPPPKSSHSRKSKDQASSTRDNRNMMGPGTGETQRILAPQRSIKSSVSGHRNQIMEANTDSNQTAHNCNAEGSMSSNMNSMDTRLASQRVSCSSEHEPVTGGTHVRKKRRENNEPDEDMKPIAKLKRPVVESGHPNSLGPTAVQQQHKAMDKRPIHKIKDITRSTENVKISLIDEVGMKLSKFVYIQQNTIYQDAYVPFSLARIADDNCCARCTGDCLSSRVPCACSRDTGGEFAYTAEGLLKDEFLEACISMNCEPQKHHLFHCQDCPLERAKNLKNPEPCKGHLLRKFIKECWRKCGCTMECGNRVVQRGTTCKLQVFSMESKGWALRTLEYLPKGSFVCEYVGEILTNLELYERNTQKRGNERHTYPVYLDADWGSEQVLKDEEALCLDATYFGNVARFINHRCHDSNLIEIPVEVETPDHHYYHIAFFTKRNVDAYEELTWDYGIDFMDDDHPIKAFECQCGSQYCRDRRIKAVGTKKKELGVKRPASGGIE